MFNETETVQTLSDMNCTVETITTMLYNITTGYAIKDDTVDVRLCVRWNLSNWTIFSGSSDYDQWHGHCRASSIADGMTFDELRKVAQEMYDEVLDSIAQSMS